MENFIAYCGINCATCPLYIATRNGDYYMKKELSAKWGQLYAKQFNIKDMECYGCKSEGRFSLSKGCYIMNCNINRNIETCTKCSIHPCERITEFYEWQKINDTKVEKVSS